MDIKRFFHVIKIGFIRLREQRIPYVSQAKEYGNNGEDHFVAQIHLLITSADPYQSMGQCGGLF
ncbi:MAG: hypothetical protein IJ043_03005 [Clostridia bacterium]|nr:hypothetical protein [Clostridia bacterium]